MPPGWTPIAISVADDALAIDWGDLGDTTFAEPFYDQTLRRWAAANPPCRRTGLDALLALPPAPPPAAIIFHLSRCGSTLLSRLLGAIPGLQSLAEPAAINDLLLAAPDVLDPATQVSAIRALAGALSRTPKNARLVLKTSSWNLRYHALFRAAFPTTPMIWLHRRPSEVLASLLRTPSGWMRTQHVPGLPAAMFSIPDSEAGRLTQAEFCARALATLLSTALQAGEITILDHADLPQAVWTTLAPSLGLALTQATLDHLRTIAAHDAKALTARPFRPAPATLAPEDRTLLASLDPLYKALQTRRHSRGLTRTKHMIG